MMGGQDPDRLTFPRQRDDGAAVRLLEHRARERRARCSALAAPGQAPPGHTGEGSHQRDVEGADRIVEPRALSLGNEPEAARARHRSSERLELPEQDTKERRLAAAVRTEYA